MHAESEQASCACLAAPCTMNLTLHCLFAGMGKDGQLGNNNLAESNPVPTTLAGSYKFSVISAGWSHTCAVATLPFPPPPSPPPSPSPPRPPNPPGVGPGCLSWELISNQVSCSACQTCPEEGPQCQVPEYYQKQTNSVTTCEPYDVSCRQTGSVLEAAPCTWCQREAAAVMAATTSEVLRWGACMHNTTVATAGPGCGRRGTQNL